jgi:hypothetical protein
VEYWVGSAKQTTKSVTATQAVFTLINVPDLTYSGAKVYFDVGSPNGKDVVAAAVTLTPKLT